MEGHARLVQGLAQVSEQTDCALKAQQCQQNIPPQNMSMRHHDAGLLALNALSLPASCSSESPSSQNLRCFVPQDANAESLYGLNLPQHNAPHFQT
eukprot:3203251-Rhodomonas_salina.2